MVVNTVQLFDIDGNLLQTYSTIQAAVDDATGGDSIHVGAGTYNENVTVSTDGVTIIGEGDVTIQGTFKSDNGISDGGVATFLQSHSYTVTTAGGTGLTVAANNVTLQNLHFDGFDYAVKVADNRVTDGLTLTGVSVTDSVVGLEKGTTGGITNLTMTNGSVSDGYIGIDFNKSLSSTALGQVDHVLIDGTSFSNLDAKGIYAETLSDARITNVTMNEVGQFGAGTAFGTQGSGGDGIDLNLKEGTYSNIEIDHFHLTDTGASDKNDQTDNPSGHKNGGAIVVEARDQGSYASTPGSFSGTVNIHDGTIDGHTSTGIQVGEPGQTNAGPAVNVTNVAISGAEHDAIHGDVGNETRSVLTVTGSPGADSIVTSGSSTGAIVIQGGGGSDTLTGHNELDTATGYTSDYHLVIAGGHWQVTNGTDTDTLTGVETVVIAGHTYELVDKLGAAVGGFQSVQAAIDAAPASGGATILIAPGTYSESAVQTGATGTGGGLYIDKPDLTLQGVKSDGSLITTAADAQAVGATIISAHETDFGSNHFVGVDGTGTTIQGLHLQAGPETDNKLLEIWANDVTVENNFVDVNVGGTTYSFAAAIYFNDNGDPNSDNITSYTVDHNILNEGIIVSNGVGDPASGVGATQQITDNQFVGHFDETTGEGRYDTVVINGQVAGVGWLLEPSQTPTMTGNTFGDNSTPFLLRGSDDSAGNLPNAAEVAQFLAINGDANTTYAYALTSGGELDTATRNDGGGVYHSFAVTNSIDTLNLALDTTADNVFGGQRNYIHSGDTLVVQSGSGTVDSQIMVDDLTVKATQNSSDLNLTLATTYADGSAIPNGGVHDITLADYAANQGANVDVTGNALDNVITGNSGNNVLDGAGGVDTLKGGGGNDTYYVENAATTVVESAGQGTDEVRSTVSYALPDNVENLTLLDASSNTQTFDSMAVGPISNGENGWTINTDPSSRDEGVVDLGGGNHAFKMSSDPGVADFAGPYSPEVSVPAGEPDTGAKAQGETIAFDIQAVSATADGSRLEIDFGNAAGTDRNNFMVIESTADGLRIAVSEPDTSGNFSGDGADPAPNDWRQLTSGLDTGTSHHVELQLEYNDGANNDVINVYVDGQFIGTTTTFENYHDALGGDHVANAQANLTDRVFFRPSANGAPQDGPGGDNQGFLIDNLSNATYNNLSATGNALANVITGNSGDNTLDGLGGNDKIDGGAGIDTAVYHETLTAANLAVDATTHDWTVTSGGADGTDQLTNVEKVTDGTHTFLLVGAGGFSTLQEALADAKAGDTILSAPGSSGSISYATDTGVLGDGITAATVLTLSGTAAANTKVSIYDNGKNLGAATSDASGAWSFITGTLASGTHDFLSLYAAGPAQASESLVVTIDPNAPNHVPVVTASDFSASPGSVRDLPDLFTASNLTVTDPDGNAVTQYQFKDDNAKAGTADDHPAVDKSGYFTVDGVVQAAGTTFTVVPDQLADTIFTVGSTPDLLWVRAFDGQEWSAWETFNSLPTSAGNSPFTPPVVTTHNLAATHLQSFAASDLFAVVPQTDPNPPHASQVITKYEFEDNTAATNSGFFLLDGQVLAAGKVIDLTAAQLADLSFQSASGSDSLKVRAFDGTNWGAWSTFKVTAPIDHAPVVTVSNHTVAKNSALAASSLVTATDSDHDPVTRYQFKDSTNTAGSGFFIVDGAAQAAGTTIDLTAAQLALAGFADFQAGTVADTLMVRASDGAVWGAWKTFHVTGTNTAPVVTALNPSAAATVFDASALFSVTDADGDQISKYQFLDTTHNAALDHFVVDGAVQPAAQAITITSDQLAGTTFDIAPSSSDVVRVRAFDGTAWGAWTNVTVTSTASHGSPNAFNITVQHQNLAHGAVVAASSLFNVTGDHSAITEYQFQDNTASATSGHFVLDGQNMAALKPIEVGSGDLSDLSFAAGSGTDTLLVRAFNGNAWSSWHSFTATAPNDVAPVITATNQAYAADTVLKADWTGASGSPHLAYSVTDHENDAITEYQFQDNTAGARSGYFAVDGVAQSAKHAIDVLASDLNQVTFTTGTSTAFEDVQVRAFDGNKWSAWKDFHILHATH